MPTYEYDCDACGHNFDEMQSFNDGAADEVPEVQEEEAPPAVRHRGGDHLQGLRLLRDRLPQRVVQVRGEGRVGRDQAGRDQERIRKTKRAKTDDAKPAAKPAKTGGAKGKAGTTGKAD